MSDSPPLVLPRGLIFLASLWLIVSWVITIGLRAPVHPSSASYTPAVRMMLLSVVTGLLIGWPLLRVSQARSPYPIRQTLLDLVVLLGLLQVVIWPLRLVTGWSPLRIAMLDATMMAWLLLTAAIVASAIGTDRKGPRLLSMIACLAICLLGPAMMWLAAISGGSAEVFVRWSPLTAVRALSGNGVVVFATGEWLWIGCVGAAALAAWLALSVAAMVQARSDQQAESVSGA